MNYFHDLITRYREKDWDRNFRPVIALFFYAMFATFAYVLVYLFLEVYYLAICTGAAFFVFIIIAVAFNRGYKKTAMFLAFFNVSILVLSSMIFIGISCGGQFFLLCALMLFVVTEVVDKPVKIVLSGLCLFEYILVNVVFNGGLPIYMISEITLLVFYQINLLATFGAVVYASRSYRTAVRQYEKKLKELNNEATYLANYDQLTGLVNRHYIYEKLDKLITEANDKNSSFVVGMADIDDFKKINDKYGHLCGDEALKMVSQSVQKSLRKNDIISRWGGEEFLIVLPDTHLPDALEILERIRISISNAVEVCGTYEMKISVTIGCAEYKKNMPLIELIKLADERMYIGKNNGKNNVVGNPSE